MKKITLLLPVFILAFFVLEAQIQSQNELFDLNTKVQSRSISFENPTGAPGEGGQAASELGVGRKGAPARRINPGEEVVLCDIQNSGTIRHIWMTGEWMDHPWLNETGRNEILRSAVIRAWWDGQDYPSIECPVGDLMGVAHGKVQSYESAIHTVGEKAAFNFWLPMPFRENAKITIKNESEKPFTLFYQIDYTINDEHPEDIGRMHVCFRRQNPTIMKQDFEILPKRTGKGRFIGALVGIRTLHPGWWGEGEIKIYMDGDDEFPTINGTGSEDWVGLSYGIQNTTFMYHGCNLLHRADTVMRVKELPSEEMVDFSPEYISMYRWHLPDPIFWDEEVKITIQQIGCCLYERDDDWSSATFWYEPIPSEPLPKMPSTQERIADIDFTDNPQE